MGAAVSKRAVILAAYVAIAAADAALGQSRLEQANNAAIVMTPPQSPPTYSPIPHSMAKAFAVPTTPLDPPRAVTATTPSLGGGGPLVPPSKPVPLPPIVISLGKGGRVDEHRQQFAIYQRAGAKVEIRGPCYSACTLVLAYVEPDHLCIAPGGFMAFHAIRTEHGVPMVGATHEYYASMPVLIQQWIRDNGGWQNLPLDGYWTMFDRALWAMGYPKCK